MLITINWLRELVKTGLPAKDLSKALTMAGLEIEGEERLDGETAVRVAVEQPHPDYVFEVNVTPNRPDCLSIAGIAREVSAITGAEFTVPPHDAKDESKTDFKIIIDDPALCPRYAGRVIKGVKIGPSPSWMRERLEKCGIRAINNVVDVTNYVLLELGHPMHAFDMSTLKGGMIRVARAGKEIEFETLDAVKRKMPAEGLLIWDEERPVAVAGIMGGADTEVTEKTVDVFLESAWFQPSSIRRTSKTLGLSSESSYRFERGADIQMLETALDRASLLIKELAGGRLSGKVDEYPGRFEPAVISVKPEKVNRILGTDIKKDEMASILRRLGLGVKETPEGFEVTTPPHRLDMTMDADVIEEIARIYGYGNIPVTLPPSGMNSRGYTVKQRLVRKARFLMRHQGLHEAVCFSFMNPSALDMLLIPNSDIRRKTVKLLNPLREEESVLRTTLAPSLIEAFSYNFSRGVREIGLFEIARVFINTGKTLPDEPLRIGGVFYNDESRRLWKDNAGEFHHTKGIVEALFAEFRITGAEFRPSSEPFLHPGKSADVFLGARRLGFIGVLSPSVTERLDVKPRSGVVIFELDMDAIIESIPGTPKYRQVPRFPHVERDVALIVEESMPSAEIISLVRAYKSEYIEEVSVFDHYKGKNIPDGKKSLAYSIRYRASDRTLTDKELEDIHEGLLRFLSEKTGAEIRGK